MAATDTNQAWQGLPGGDLILQGLEDLTAEVESVEALLVAIGSVRMRRAGVPVPEGAWVDPERRLYALLERDGPETAHSRYNALIRRLVSFERALEGSSTR